MIFLCENSVLTRLFSPFLWILHKSKIFRKNIFFVFHDLCRIWGPIFCCFSQDRFIFIIYFWRFAEEGGVSFLQKNQDTGLIYHPQLVALYPQAAGKENSASCDALKCKQSSRVFAIAKIPTPCALQASLQIFGRGNRTKRRAALGRIGCYPCQGKKKSASCDALFPWQG